MFEQIQFRVAAIVFLIMLVMLSIFTVINVYLEQQRAEEELLRKGKMLAFTGAVTLSRLLENAIDTGQLTREEAFDTDYQYIPGTSPPKYTTLYKEFMDREIQDILDAFQKDEEVVFAVLTDRNGYVSTHNSNFRERAGRIFDDEVGLTAARNREGFLQQVYRRDTGEIMWDISYPVYIQEEHWGAFRIGFSMEKIAEKKYAIMKETIIGVGIMVIITGIAVYFITWKSISPLA